MTRLTPLLLLALVTAGCGGNANDASASSDAAAPAAPASAASTASPPGTPTSASAPQTADAAPPVPATLPKVVARVNGEEISDADLQRAVANLESQAGPVPAERRDEVFRGVLNELIAYRLLLQESKARQISVTDAEIESRVGEVKQQFPNDGAFQSALAERGMSAGDLRDEIRVELAIARIVEAEVGPKVQVADQDVSSFYAQNPDQFKQPERVRASHVLIQVDANASPEVRTAARTRIEGLLQEVRDGADFASIAKTHSQDGSAANGGDLNFFARGDMVPAFEAAAFALQPGGISGVVETQFGYHIIKVTDRQASQTVPFDQVREQIGQFLRAQQQQVLARAFVDALRQQGDVEVFI